MGVGEGSGKRLSAAYHLVVRDEPKSPAAEAIRLLRTNLQYAALDRPLKRLLITSAGPGEGKTSIAANLAISLADTGKRIVVVGVDLRKPSIHDAFGCPNAVGVTNILVGQIRLEDALQETGIDNLQLLASGPIPPNPAELIGSEAMQRLIERLDDHCDIVIYDTTPVMAVTDAVLLSRSMDGVLLVVSINQMPRELVARAKEQLEHVNAKILGVVANRVPIRGREYGYYAYYGIYNGVQPSEELRSNGAVPDGRLMISRMLARFVGRG